MNEPIPDWYVHERHFGANTVTYKGVQESDLRSGVILFGAGASFGCGHTTPSTPPLGNQLFGALRETCSSWKDLPADLAAEFRPSNEATDRWDFERGMAHIMDRLPVNLDQLLRELGYFLCEFEVDLSGEDAYTRLLKQMQACGSLSPTLFATLNYDRILESAAHNLRLKIHFGRHAPWLMRDVWLYKLHGSCTFVPPVYDFQGVPMVVESRDVAAYIEGRPTNARQVMSLYEPGKGMIGETASWLKKMHLGWTAMIRNAQQICIIGAAPPGLDGRDAHIWGPIRDTTAPVAYVGSEDDYEKLELIRTQGDCEHLGTSFAAAVHAIAERMPAAKPEVSENLITE